MTKEIQILRVGDRVKLKTSEIIPPEFYVDGEIGIVTSAESNRWRKTQLCSVEFPNQEPRLFCSDSLVKL